MASGFCTVIPEPHSNSSLNCPQCGVSQECRTKIKAAAELVGGKPLDVTAEEALLLDVVRARCAARKVTDAESLARRASEHIGKVRSDLVTLQRLKEMLSRHTQIFRCTQGTPDAQNEFIMLFPVIDKWIEYYLQILSIYADIAEGRFIKQELVKVDSDIFSEMRVRLNKKHALDVLVFECTIAWMATVDDEHPKIGRPRDEKENPTPFMRFLIAAAEPLNRKLGITPASLAERARQILGRR